MGFLEQWNSFNNATTFGPWKIGRIDGVFVLVSVILRARVTSVIYSDLVLYHNFQVYRLKAGVHMKAVFWLVITALALVYVSSNQESLCSSQRSMFWAVL